MPNVTIRLQDDSVSNPRIEDVAVEFYDTDGVFQTSGTTDEDGEVTVSLPVDFYDVMFFMQGLTILPSQPQRIEVLSPGPNIFLVTGHIRALPESSNPLKTKVSGFLLGGALTATRTRVMISPAKDLLIVGTNVILPESRVEFSSSDAGYFEFELVRGLKYVAIFRDMDEFMDVVPPTFSLIVPDAPGIALDTLFFPLPVSLEHDDDTLSLIAGAEDDVSIGYFITYSDGSETDNRPSMVPWSSLQATSSDETVATVVLEDGHLRIDPIAPGTTTISTIRHFNDAVLWTDPPAFVTTEVVVTVS
jgi:hypothetical protein